MLKIFDLIFNIPMRGRRYAPAAGYTKMNLINRAVKTARGYANEIVYVFHSLIKIFRKGTI